MDTAEAKPAAAPQLSTFILKRSKIVVAYDPDYPSKDVIAAQKAAGKDSAAFALYLAQRICTFDGEKLSAGAIREKVRGRDYLQLAGEILSDGDDASEADDDAGNATRQ